MNNISFNPFPNLLTELLNLRQLKLEDYNEIYSLRSNKSVNEYINRPQTTL